MFYFDRCAPVWVVVTDGWTIAQRRSAPGNIRGGQHGFDNLFPNMRPIFFAVGPDIVNRNGAPIDLPIRSVDVYPMIAHLLSIRPALTNGTLAFARQLLRNPPSLSQNITFSQ
jgi:predicted AlkP superfamily pyrophosphatase or phosphodiesterase